MTDRQAKNIIKRFENAVRDHEMKGCQHPDDWETIDRNLANARKALDELIFGKPA